jgi:hypothetical protein
MADAPFDPTAGGFPSPQGMPSGEPSALPGQPETYFATLACTINLQVQASSPEQAQQLLGQRSQDVMDKMNALPGFEPNILVLLDPDTGMAVDAFLLALRTEADS